MAHFVLTYAYNDTPLRAERRDDHVAHLDTLKREGALVLAGPLADRTGGIIILSAEDEDAAKQLVERDPYTQLDVTKDRELREWTITVGTVAQ